MDNYVRTNEAAQRVLDSLADDIHVEKSSRSKRMPEPKSADDSGIGDDGSLDSWRMQAEAVVRRVEMNSDQLDQ